MIGVKNYGQFVFGKVAMKPFQTEVRHLTCMKMHQNKLSHLRQTSSFSQKIPRDNAIIFARGKLVVD